jgi:hypothetical protein
MARKLRVQFPGAVYHVLDRGDRREEIFCDDGPGNVPADFGRGLRADGLEGAWLRVDEQSLPSALATPEANLAADEKNVKRENRPLRLFKSRRIRIGMNRKRKFEKRMVRRLKAKTTTNSRTPRQSRAEKARL